MFPSHFINLQWDFPSNISVRGGSLDIKDKQGLTCLLYSEFMEQDPQGCKEFHNALCPVTVFLSGEVSDSALAGVKIRPPEFFLVSLVPENQTT
jgi:hypothetical protein